MPKVMRNDGASREGVGLRGDQCFVISSSVYFFSAPALFPSSPPHRPDRYCASTKVWEKANEHVSQSTLTELKAMEFEISQAAVSIPSPFLPLRQTFCSQDVACIYCRWAGSCVDCLSDFPFSYEKLYNICSLPELLKCLSIF